MLQAFSTYEHLALSIKISADDIFFFFFFFSFFSPENRLWHFMQIVFLGDNLHDVSKSIFGGKKQEKYNEFFVCWIRPDKGEGWYGLLTSTSNTLPMNTNKQWRAVIAFVRDRKCLVLKLMHLRCHRQLRWNWWAPRPWTFQPRLVVLLLRWDTELWRMHWTSIHGAFWRVWKVKIITGIRPRVCTRQGTFAIFICHALIGRLQTTDTD